MSRELSRHSGIDPVSKLGDLLFWPFSVAGHGAFCQSLKDVLGILADVLVVPEIESELH